MEEKEEKPTEDATELQEKDEEDPEPEFLKSTFLESYVQGYKSRTVVIEPFHSDLLAEVVIQTWIKQTKEFYIRKAWTSKTIGLLHFETEYASEKALTELTESLVKEGSKISVYHPCFDNLLEKCNNHYFIDEKLGIDKLEEEAVFPRQIVLSGVPDSMAVDTIQKHFAQAVNVLDFRDDPDNKGIVTVEFASKEEAETVVQAQQEVRIDGTALSINMFPWSANLLGKDYRRAYLDVLKKETEQFKPLNDELRVDMCKAHKALEDERCRLFNRTDIYSQDKKTENTRICALMKPYQEHLIADTRRRIEAGDKTVPESQDLMIAPVKIIMDAEKNMYFHPIPDQPSAKMKSLVDKAAQRASVKLSLLEKVKKVSDERNRKAAEVMTPKPKPKVKEKKDDEGQAIQVISNTPTRGRGRGTYSDQNRFQSGYGSRNTFPIPTRGGGAGSSFADWGSRVARGAFVSNNRGRGRGGYNYSNEDEPFPKRFRGGGGGGRRNFGGAGASDTSGKSLDEMQAMLEERLRRLEEMQLQTLQVQSKMLANAAAQLQNPN